MNSSRLLRYIFVLWVIVSILLLASVYSQGGSLPAPTKVHAATLDAIPADPVIPADHLISTQQLNTMLKNKPVLLQVGSRTLYQQAHIPGSQYIGPGSSDQGRTALVAAVKSVPKNKLIVIYCGCCPWGHCPNMHPAYKQLGDLGYTNVKALYIANNFGADWVDKGYPTANGE